MKVTVLNVVMLTVIILIFYVHYHYPEAVFLVMCDPSMNEL